MSLTRCSRCQGFIPGQSLSCPNCAAPSPARGLLSRVGLAGGILGGGAVAFTLMACYGMAPCNDPNGCYGTLPEDAGTDAGALDAGADANVGVDAGSDAAVDAAVDTGSPGTDAGSDAATDASFDSGDASGETDADLDAGDAGG
jgi:hypothetical protein